MFSTLVEKFDCDNFSFRQFKNRPRVGNLEAYGVLLRQTLAQAEAFSDSFTFRNAE